MREAVENMRQMWETVDWQLDVSQIDDEDDDDDDDYETNADADA